ncbi:GNAT family N-acetyltransferase [Phytomonospora endophytica]|uniref:GNAT superfamily N-acetyltransferase n=1 Tax=Phytomonospora endophytica TaxID=714109 RepID=A0A841FZX2_9ACTN|nr:GNAT family N-acetyltransferase [Phytomonospora endophytica]MBB6038947.1 GNAT superfamily N-acetyltransferase [Phytomonospora endophytica]GIG67951.1 N-acetyltransferase [Phytomonospora endophytica]
MSLVQVLPAADRPIPPEGVLALYAEAGWWPERTAAHVEKILAVCPAVGAWNADGELVGFARAVSDGVCRAYVEDVVVAESLRGQGIGRRLMDALNAELAGIDVVSLFCGPDLVDFYETTGFAFTGQRIAHRAKETGADA